MTVTSGGAAAPRLDPPHDGDDHGGSDDLALGPGPSVVDEVGPEVVAPAPLPDEVVVPRWLEALLAALTCVPAAVVLIGVVLAGRGEYRTATTLLLGLPTGLLLSLAVARPSFRRRPPDAAPGPDDGPADEDGIDEDGIDEDGIESDGIDGNGIERDGIGADDTDEVVAPDVATDVDPGRVGAPADASDDAVAGSSDDAPDAIVPGLPVQVGPPRAALGTHLAAAVAVALALTLTSVLHRTAGEHVIANRDPSIYQTTAVWMSRTGTLYVEPRAGGLEAVDPARLVTKAGAVYDVGGGRLEFQFAHGASVLLAVAFDLAGPGPMHGLPALAIGVGLLGVYVVTLRATRRPWLALVAPVVLGVALPWWFVGRDTYSEPFTIALLWGAVALLGGVAVRPRPAAGAALGAVLGAILAVRADAGLYVAALLFLAGAGAMSSRAPDGGARRWTFAALVGAFALTALVGIVDLVEHTGFYVDAVGDEVRMVLGLLLVAAGGGALLGTLGGLHPRLGAAGRSAGRVLATPAALAVVVLLTLLWWMRPFLDQAIDRGFVYSIVGAIQQRDGLTVNARRLYSEDTVRWMQWYFGPLTVGLGIAGIAWTVRATLRGRASATAAFVALTTAGAGAVYFWNPHITADHPWASRRFAPMVYPGFVVMAVVAVGLVCGPLRRPDARRTVAAVVLAAVMVAVPATVTWPLRDLAPQRSYLKVLQQACAAAGPDATVLVRGGFEQITLQQAVRAWCDVPAAGTGAGFDEEELRAVARAARRQGRRVVLLTMDLGTSEGLPEDLLGEPRTFGPAHDRTSVLPTVDRVPSRFSPPDPDLPENRPGGFTLHVVPVLAE